jgi:PPOX class probable F420-dependent enzyme
MERFMAVPNNVRRFLDEKRFAVLATINSDGTPQQTVMWYVLDGDEILMNTAVGRVKDSNLRRDQRISICIEDGYSFVTLTGTARLIDDQTTAQADIRRLAIRYHGAEQGNRMAEEQFSRQQRVTIRVPIARVVANNVS